VVEETLGTLQILYRRRTRHSGIQILASNGLLPGRGVEAAACPHSGTAPSGPANVPSEVGTGASPGDRAKDHEPDTRSTREQAQRAPDGALRAQARAGFRTVSRSWPGWRRGPADRVLATGGAPTDARSSPLTLKRAARPRDNLMAHHRLEERPDSRLRCDRADASPEESEDADASDGDWGVPSCRAVERPERRRRAPEGGPPAAAEVLRQGRTDRACRRQSLRRAVR